VWKCFCCKFFIFYFFPQFQELLKKQLLFLLLASYLLTAAWFSFLFFLGGPSFSGNPCCSTIWTHSTPLLFDHKMGCRSGSPRQWWSESLALVKRKNALRTHIQTLHLLLLTDCWSFGCLWIFSLHNLLSVNFKPSLSLSLTHTHIFISSCVSAVNTSSTS